VTDRERVVRDSYRAWRTADRQLIERCLSQDLSFHSPPDPSLDREGYFERCWPHAGQPKRFEIKRLIESGDVIVVTYVATRADDTRFRNTEVFSFDPEDRIRAIEVYFGWDL
jgi:ketosteroid isomerase-like protein